MIAIIILGIDKLLLVAPIPALQWTRVRRLTK